VSHSTGLDAFFYPQSVAVVGASADPRKTGHALLKNLLNYGYGGKIYPVNPGADELLGLPSYNGLGDLPPEIDLAVFTIPAAAVVESLRSAPEVRIRAAVVHSGGFAEAGEEGRRLQAELLALARTRGMRIIGPNCMGVMCTESRVPWARRTTFPEVSGGVSVVSQSGGGGGSLVNLADQRGIRFSKIVTIGNECDVTVTDCIDYFGSDPNTKIIVVYLEGLRDGHRFVDIARRVAAHKPVICYKIGRTTAGGKAAASHTGSLAGSIEVYDGVFRQTGILRGSGIDPVLDYLVAFSAVWLPKSERVGPRIGVVTGPGGPGVATVDACVEAGLEVPDITAATKASLAQSIPGATLANPMDMADFSLVARLKEKNPYGIMVDLMDRDENIDMIAVVGPGEANPEGFRDVVLGISETCRKPFVVIWPSAGTAVDECKRRLEGHQVPLFMTPERGAAALSALVQYQRLKAAGEAAKFTGPPALSAPVKEQVRAILGRARGESRSMLTEYEAKQIFSLCDIPVNAGKLVASAADAVAYFVGLARPVAMKIVSPQIVHKTDAGCVRLNLQRAEEVAAAFDELMANARRYDPQADVHGILIQELIARPAIEVIVGASRDPTFGPVLMFGLGGIFVECIRDVTFRAAPLSAADALAMVRDIRGHRVFAKAGISETDCAGILLKISMLVEQFEEISELDMNPLFADASGVMAVDARILLRM
jgi:acyl-CoA synthetase (NDP forming)